MRGTFYQAIGRADPMTVLRVVRHLPDFIKLYWRLFRDPRVFVLAKVLLVVGLVYVISPVDLLFDVLPILGWLDDAAVLVLTVGGFIRLCPPLVVQEHVQLIDEERGIYGSGSRD
jgi:uncharacterized membrane protein YkvA (DUF1232 family)